MKRILAIILTASLFAGCYTMPPKVVNGAKLFRMGLKDYTQRTRTVIDRRIKTLKKQGKMDRVDRLKELRQKSDQVDQTADQMVEAMEMYK